MGLDLTDPTGTYATEVDDGDETYEVTFVYGRIDLETRTSIEMESIPEDRRTDDGPDEIIPVEQARKLAVAATQDVEGLDFGDDPVDWSGDIAEQAGLDCTDYEARCLVFDQLYGSAERPAAADRRVYEYVGEILNSSSLDTDQKKESATSSDSD